MTCGMEEGAPARGRLPDEGLGGSQARSVEHHDREDKDVLELLELGRDAFEPCGGPYMTVLHRFETCGRPRNHPGPCHRIPSVADLVEAPYAEPDEALDAEDYLTEWADNWNDDRAVGLA